MTSKYQQQLDREKTSASAGLAKFNKTKLYNEETNNASNNDFGLFVKQHLLGEIVEKVAELTAKTLGTKGKELPLILERCLKANRDGTTTSFFDAEMAAFVALQKTLDTALNPNKVDRKRQGKYGSDKRLMEKMTLRQLERQVGEIINQQMALSYIQKLFPSWFRKKQKELEGSGATKASTSYFQYNMERAINDFADYLYDKGEIKEAELIRERKSWTHRECSVIGGLVLNAVFSVCGDYITTTDSVRRSKTGKERKVIDVVLTKLGKEKEQGISEFVAQFSHDLLPMLVEPIPITNDSLGGWLTDTFHSKQEPSTGSIKLSGKHLEFINRQARMKFQLNPFIYELTQRLYEDKLSLGKFYAHKIEQPESVSTRLGISGEESPEKIQRMRAHPDYLKVKREVSKEHAQVCEQMKENMLARFMLDKAEKIKDDEYNYYPMDYDFRGRIYSRVPFISFQSTDAGRYMIRFAEKTPIDSRTQFWLKVGIANAAGVDKVCWDDRVRWFDKHKDDIINIGKMMDNGDFDRAYEFLKEVDDPFCLAALANEYVKVFVDKTQTYTQVFVYVDCSCSGTSIFNAWRRNEHGARMTNLVDTPEPADIYLEVWREIRRQMPDDVFNERRIKRLEKSKLLRKMMKSTYVPASYASPTTEQHNKLWEFNKTKLKDAGLAFSENEMEVLCKLWDVALDKVSSISSVVSWFQARVNDAVSNGATEITYTTSNGSVMTLKYPKTTLRRVRTFHMGSAAYRQSYEMETSPEMNARKMKTAITANITHATDAAALCAALWDCETPFVALHDAVGKPPGKQIDEGIRRLKLGLIEACRHSVWDTFRLDNNLPFDDACPPPIIDDLDLDDIIHSTYLFA